VAKIVENFYSTVNFCGDTVKMGVGGSIGMPERGAMEGPWRQMGEHS